MRISWKALVLALVLVLGTNASARAEYLNWSYSWSMVPPSITSKTGLAGVVGATGFGVGTTDPIQAVTLSTFATGSSTAPEDVEIESSPYDLTLTLQDTDNPALLPQTLTFQGAMSGIVSTSDVSLTNSFVSSIASVVMGDYLYSVTLTGFTSPTLNSTGSITAQIVVTRYDEGGGNGGGDPVTKTPEPSSLVLAALVIPIVLWYRMRRQGQVSTASLAV